MKQSRDLQRGCTQVKMRKCSTFVASGFTLASRNAARGERFPALAPIAGMSPRPGPHCHAPGYALSHYLLGSKTLRSSVLQYCSVLRVRSVNPGQEAGEIQVYAHRGTSTTLAIRGSRVYS